MRNLIIAFIFTFIGFTAFATENSIKPIKTTNVAFEEPYTEVGVEELPMPVLESFSENFPAAEIYKAYVNQEKQFKLEVELKDGSVETLIADENGNWIK
ncbi:hypothetical protein KO500_04075 [Cellulophaga baltica]|uniref:hypothetical protein n=1 Tax=Cellulophaga TaxID=104264 RepID=UPI001C0710B0|nr:MULTISPECIES: hypothetical protein [Cellulophaga]MBU2995592.1 hypothetical protein [Cellulophaga baltica]MDO6766986.1 hypothetical protein [Cellulophaga sp. 1_MG-2023]